MDRPASAPASSAPPATDAGGLAALGEFIDRHTRLFVLTGAGCSTGSGIPDYRDADGQWKRSPPIDFQAFMGYAHMRARYWARSTVGWRRFGHMRPNAAHLALALLEQRGHVQLLVTQNVDGLHQAAGSHNVLDLHGRLDEVRCMNGDWRGPRAAWQAELDGRNPGWAALDAADAPDGDADLEGVDFSSFVVPACPRCGGIVKPDVVFFGESIPPERGVRARAALEQADAVLVVGSSLMVHSGYRYVRAAAENGQPIAALNLGRTRADALFSLKVAQPCAPALDALYGPFADRAAAQS
ncbi:NAD-dependent protein deacetylase [Bordetella petrii]|uniref:NAD-dependent protein deacetylase n=1 Tax=Bordetella petrii TaxID=94624 RepID=UPI001E53F620|nr:NAD-dependent protein deacetylase [Bordetella petrii]MCD0504330.1 NAD-dependent protein deacetylase [Bordetella petrii]